MIYPDPYITSKGRPNKYKYDFYLKQLKLKLFPYITLHLLVYHGLLK